MWALKQNKTHIEAQSAIKCYSLFSDEAVVVAKVDQRLVIEQEAAEAISNSEALRNQSNEGKKRILTMFVPYRKHKDINSS